MAPTAWTISGDFMGLWALVEAEEEGGDHHAYGGEGHGQACGTSRQTDKVTLLVRKLL